MVSVQISAQNGCCAPRKFASLAPPKRLVLRHKARPETIENTILKKPLRIFLHALSAPESLASEVVDQFSAMKYGDPKAVEALGKQMALKILGDEGFQARLAQAPKIYLAAAAFGAVPSAANTLCQVIGQVFQANNIPCQSFKIVRNGGFARTNYGALTSLDREKAIRARKISFENGWAAQLKDQLVLIIDDLRSTGAHERALLDFFDKETQNAQVVFSYCIGFQDGVLPALEERLNHNLIQRPEDLLPLFQNGPDSPLLNARMLKFILLLKGKRMRSFLDQIGEGHALRLYNAAISSDGYCLSARFRNGFTLLENWVFEAKIIPVRHSFKIRNEAQNKLVVCNIEETEAGDFIDSESGRMVNDDLNLYSRFKFGDVEAIQILAKRLATRMIAALEAGGSLRDVFTMAKEANHFVSITAPGVRNVVSASNFLMREAAVIVNLWLTKNEFPTMIIRSLARLGSGTANYAELSAKDRSERTKTTQTIIPRSEYMRFPTHVIFVDDVEVTGQTSNRARSNSISAGAKSFHAVFAFRVHPQQAKQDAGIEHRLNQFEVTGKLDEGLSKILSHPDYQPVQRMLRLLLHPRNQNELCGFLAKNISDKVLLRIYLAAMNNDYLWIHPQASNQFGEYGPSLKLVESELQNRQVIDDKGLPFSMLAI